MRVSGNLVVIGTTANKPVTRMNARLYFESLKSCPQSCPHVMLDTFLFTTLSNKSLVFKHWPFSPNCPAFSRLVFSKV